MNGRTLVARGLRHYWRTHLGVVAGTAVAGATLVGALLVGDSVRGTLRARAEARIGRVSSALVGGDRFFASDLAERVGASTGAGTAPLVQLRGVAATPEGARRVLDVGVLGVDERFFALAPEPHRGSAGVYINRALERRLELDVGGELVLRLERPSALPRDMSLAGGDAAAALRLRVDGIAEAGDFGDFDLLGGSIPRPAVFVPLARLQAELELGERANLLLSDGPDTAALDRAVRKVWTPDDAELELRDLPNGGVELVSRRIVLDPPLCDLLESSELPLTGIFTYFVNALRAGERSTPYSMVTAIGALAGEPSIDVPGADLGGGEVAINTWLADDLGVDVGDDVELDYYVIDASRRLVTEQRTLRVARVVPIEGAAADAGLTPEFPGISGKASCRDWEPGTPIELDAIGDEDEAYWSRYGSTPKAFVALETGRELWRSRFGELTAVRFAKSDEAALRGLLQAELDPRSLGLFFRDVRSPAELSGDSPTDFGGLFIGLSMFLLAAGLLLAAQLFLFGVEQRGAELGLYAALGLRPRQIRRWFLLEAAVLAAFGAGIGAVLGIVYTRVVLAALASIWSDAVSGAAIEYHGTAATVAIGFVASMSACLATVAVASRATLRTPTHRLLTSSPAVEATASSATRGGYAVAIVCGALALLVALVVAPESGPAAAGAFFGAGTSVLVGALFWIRTSLRRRGVSSQAPVATLTRLGVEGTVRRPGRSVATVALVAIGTFLVVAVGANRLGPVQGAGERSSGTGGFALFGQSSVPIVEDLNSERGRDVYGLGESELEDVSVVALRARAGDDASCLNLARPQVPRLLGVPVGELRERRAFAFASVEGDSDDPWSLLERERDDRAIPVFGDTTSLTWQMHKKVGDTVELVDERGRRARLRIVGAIVDTVLQGDLLMAEQRFEELFPGEGGHRVFLIDAPPDRVDAVSSLLSRGLRDAGLAVQTTGARLDGFHAVQNSYLSIFQVLGGLGLLLGSVGLGAVLLRNTLERRAELALATALGFAPGRVRWWIASEYGFLLMVGLGAGALAALVAIVPALRAPGSTASLASLGLVAGAVAVSGVFWVAVATRVALARVPLRGLAGD